jgi:regulator of cell morphogenesis and NO signaling
MNELKSKTLAQIVTEDHRAAAVFEKFHLDFCCKGKRTLEQACTENKLEPEMIVSELLRAEQVKATSVIPFEQYSLTHLADHIVSNHHVYVKNEMPAILMYLQKIAAKHGGRHPEMIKVFELFADMKNEMDMHMVKEEKVLFPRIKELEKYRMAGDEINFSILHLQSPISMMEEEHEHAGAAMAEIRKLTNNYTAPDDACTTYRLSFAALEAFEQDLHQHIHLENNILFPKSMELFGGQLLISAN